MEWCIHSNFKMIRKFLFDWLCKDYIKEEVEQCFRENMIERYWSQKQNETAKRIAELRKKYLSPQSRQAADETEAEVLSGSNIRREDTESRVQSKTDAQAMKDKLRGLNNGKT